MCNATPKTGSGRGTPQMGHKIKAGRLVAVVVTHNRLAQLQQTLARLTESAQEVLDRIVVVDNASTDGTGAWLAEHSEARLDILTLDTNTGGAGGFAAGLRHAVTAHDPDWLVVMDDDARPVPGALEAFQAAPRDAVEGWAAAVYHPDGRICDINRPAINPFWHRDVFWRTALGRGRDGFHLGPTAYEAPAPTPVDEASFVGFFISRAGVARAGYPDGALFIYGDDVLYTLGLTARGGRILFDPALRFDHDFQTQGQGERRMRPLWKVYYHHRNLMLVYRMAAGAWFWPALLIILPKWATKIRDYKGERRLFLRLIVRAVWDGIRGRTRVSHDQVQEWVRMGPSVR